MDIQISYMVDKKIYNKTISKQEQAWSNTMPSYNQEMFYHASPLILFSKKFSN